MSINLFISFLYFDFKTIKDNDLRNNIRNNFLFDIYCSFNSFVSSSNSSNHFKTLVISTENNKSLFYTGVEHKAKALASNYVDIIKDYVINTFNSYSEIETKIIKMKIGKDKTKSLLCILVILDLSTNDNKQIHELNETKTTFILFPLKFDDFH